MQKQRYAFIAKGNCESTKLRPLTLIFSNPFQAHGQFESMVPLLMYHHNLSAQDAMNRAAEMCHECYREFDEVEEEMYKKIPTYLRPTMERYLMACKDLIVCNVHWR